jgi:hypothetical protein
MAPGFSLEVGPSGQALTDWLRELDEENRTQAARLGYENVRAEAQRQVQAGPMVGSAATTAVPISLWDDGLPRRGSPLRWQATEADASPALTLVPLRTWQRERALLGSVALVCGLLVVWLLSRWPMAVVWSKAFWPEQVALLGYLGWQVGGPNLLFAFLCLLGVCGRLILLVRWLAVALRRPAPRRPSTATAHPLP